MVKPSKPESQPSEELPEDFSHAHPLMRQMSQTQELLERAMSRKDAEDFKIKEIAEWKLCVNAVASTPNGRMFIRSMIQFSGMFTPPKRGAENQKVIDSIRSAFYLTWVRPYLEPEVRKELE